MGYKLVRSHKVTTHEVEGNTVHALKHKVKNEEMYQLVVPQQNLFHAIMEAHLQIGHKRHVATFNKLMAKYHTITESLCTLFIQTCPTCNGEAPREKKANGAKCPIMSSSFIDCFQVDLISKDESTHKKIGLGML